VRRAGVILCKRSARAEFFESCYPTHDRDEAAVMDGAPGGRVRFAVSHPKRKNKDAPRMGHPAKLNGAKVRFRFGKPSGLRL
jgi:hypothetical protein